MQIFSVSPFPNRVEFAKELLYKANNSPELLKSIITGDETLGLQIWNQDSIVPAAVSWIAKIENVVWQVWSNVKVKHTLFLDFNGKVQYEFLSQDQMIN